MSEIRTATPAYNNAYLCQLSYVHEDHLSKFISGMFYFFIKTLTTLNKTEELKYVLSFSFFF